MKHYLLSFVLLLAAITYGLLLNDHLARARQHQFTQNVRGMDGAGGGGGTDPTFVTDTFTGQSWAFDTKYKKWIELTPPIPTKPTQGEIQK